MDKFTTDFVYSSRATQPCTGKLCRYLVITTVGSGNELAKTLREVQQRAHSRAKALADWISKQVSAHQSSIGDVSGKNAINQMSTVARGSHPLSVVALAIAFVALVVAIASFVTVNPMLRFL